MNYLVYPPMALVFFYEKKTHGGIVYLGPKLIFCQKKPEMETRSCLIFSKLENFCSKDQGPFSKIRFKSTSWKS